MERINRVVYVDTSYSQSEVRDLFSPCGAIRGLYRWTSEREKVHYFVEFTQIESVNRARVSKLPIETHVHSLAFIPQLIDRFCTLAEQNGDALPQSVRPKQPRRTDVIPEFGIPNFSSVLNNKNFPISTRNLRQGDKENKDRPRISAAPKQLPVSLTSPSVPSNSPRSKRLTLSLCDQSIACDLETLEDDPKGIVALLKACSCECDKWMIVAAEYRGRGNCTAAVTVVTAMVEVMTHAGMAEGDLKPAFLMLSSCQRDLGKRARSKTGTDSEVALSHFQQSEEWLRKVYGVDVPPPAPETVPGEPSAPTDPDSNTSANELQLLPALFSSKVPSVKNPLPPNTTSINNRVRILEREVNALRDRNAEHQNLLSESKGQKRKLEDELVCEKSARRKVETKLGQLETELQLVQRMESFALEQVKREVDSRRKAENREKGLKQRVEEMEREAGNGMDIDPNGSGIFEDLSRMFQNASHGKVTRKDERGMFLDD